MRLTKHKKEDEIRDLFFIVKGQYNRNYGVESFDPDSDHCKQHYMLMDNKCFNVVASGSSLKDVLKSLEKKKKKYKTKDRYFKMLDTYTTEDYYRVTYKGLPPYTEKQLNDLIGEGRRCRVSPPMKQLYKDVYDLYGDYFREECEEVENRAYESVSFQTPLERSRKLMRNKSTLTPKKDKETPNKHLTGLSKKKEETLKRPTMKKGLVRKPMQKLSMQ